MQRDIILIGEMIDAAEQVQSLAEGVSAAELATDRVRRDALLWNFAVLGEASGQVSGETVEAFPELPWRRPVELRNRIVHGYWSIDLDILHTTATDQLPEFVRQLRKVLETLSSTP